MSSEHKGVDVNLDSELSDSSGFESDEVEVHQPRLDRGDRRRLRETVRRHTDNIMGRPDLELMARNRAKLLADVRSRDAKKTRGHTLAVQSKNNIAHAKKLQQEGRAAPTVTQQIMSTTVRNIKDAQWLTYNPLAEIGSPNFEESMPVPGNTKKPCMHCNETFDHPPLVLMKPHIDHKFKRHPPFTFRGCFCSGPCMITFYRERGMDQELAFAHQSCDRFGLSIPQPFTANAPDMRGWGGDTEPMRGAGNIRSTTHAPVEGIPEPVGFNKQDMFPPRKPLLLEEQAARLAAASDRLRRMGVPAAAPDGSICKHCARPVTGQPFMFLHPAIPQQHLPANRVSRWTKQHLFCCGPCMVGFAASRRCRAMVEQAQASCEQFNLRTPQPAMPPSFALTTCGGPIEPQADDCTRVHTRWGHYLPAAVSVTLNLGKTVFRENGGDPRGWRIPKNIQPFLPTRTRQMPIIEEFQKQLEEGVSPEDAVVRGVEAKKFSNSSTSFRRTRVKNVTTEKQQHKTRTKKPREGADKKAESFLQLFAEGSITTGTTVRDARAARHSAAKRKSIQSKKKGNE